jgi:hypothetical protein
MGVPGGVTKRLEGHPDRASPGDSERLRTDPAGCWARSTRETKNGKIKGKGQAAPKRSLSRGIWRLEETGSVKAAGTSELNLRAGRLELLLDLLGFGLARRSP